MAIVMPLVSDVYRAGQHGNKCKRVRILAYCNQWQPKKHKDLLKKETSPEWQKYLNIKY